MALGCLKHSDSAGCNDKTPVWVWIQKENNFCETAILANGNTMFENSFVSKMHRLQNNNPRIPRVATAFHFDLEKTQKIDMSCIFAWENGYAKEDKMA